MALGCAAAWATAIILFRFSGEGIPARALNLYKNGLSFGLMLPTLYFVEGRFFVPTPPKDFAIVFLSVV